MTAACILKMKKVASVSSLVKSPTTVPKLMLHDRALVNQLTRANRTVMGDIGTPGDSRSYLRHPSQGGVSHLTSFFPVFLGKNTE